MKEEQATIVRILVYRGPISWLQQTGKNNWLKGKQGWGDKRLEQKNLRIYTETEEERKLLEKSWNQEEGKEVNKGGTK